MIVVAVQQEMDVEAGALQQGAIIAAHGARAYNGKMVLSGHARIMPRPVALQNKNRPPLVSGRRFVTVIRSSSFRILSIAASCLT
jgi:hypothetical protein